MDSQQKLETKGLSYLEGKIYHAWTLLTGTTLWSTKLNEEFVCLKNNKTFLKYNVPKILGRILSRMK